MKESFKKDKIVNSVVNKKLAPTCLYIHMCQHLYLKIIYTNEQKRPYSLTNRLDHNTNV